MNWKNPPGKRYFGKPVTDDPDDAPELLDDFFRDAVYHIGEKVVSREEFAASVNARLRKVRKLKKA